MYRTRPTTRRALAGALLGTALLLSACSADDDVAAGEDTAALGDVAGADVPEECTAAFPLTVTGDADIADVESVPADFPPPPDGATLCETGGTADGGQEYANYASGLGAEEVLAHYESAAPGAERTETGLGEPAVSGTAGGVFWQVEPVDGGFRLVFAAA
ncbi:hypothetical protein SAMN04488107_0964 [Geodermatophilus saharensis]|uniref:Uncharacterized protein n=1 Tax=Geodermatophilus saharensis TaxID=1137994 RepID=A0A239B6G4_9ACTN|nr:hypothetical protein [Geodermatophilus saharensis]SNS03460.1 hypothetical protein SAMN04488107_0964 [Geodermatophilus saharensis]